MQGDADRARKHGMEDFISADPCTFEHATLFKLLQNLTLEFRLNDPYCSLVSTSFKLKLGYFDYCGVLRDRVGSVLVRSSSWTNTARVMGYAAVIDICATSLTFWIVPRRT